MNIGVSAAVALTIVLTFCAGCSKETFGQPGASPSLPPGSGGPSTPAASTPVTPQPVPVGDPTKTPAGGFPSNVNRFDASSVAAAVAAITFRYDTVIDNSPADAQRRAMPWLTPALAAQLAGGQAAAPGAEWNTWAQHRAYTAAVAVDATEDGAPPDTTTLADRTINVTVTPIGRDRWRGTTRQYALYVSLTRTGTKSSWKVSQLRLQE